MGRQRSTLQGLYARGGYTIYDGTTLTQHQLDAIATRLYPCAGVVALPLQEKTFWGAHIVAATYKQLFHNKYPMKNMGIGLQLEGQCFKPVITWIAATIKATSSKFCNMATNVSIINLNLHIKRLNYLLHTHSEKKHSSCFDRGQRVCS